MPDPKSQPPTCEIRDWVVFGPGYWRGSLYTPADCDRVPVNFRKLLGYVNPVVKLGHDREQHLTERLKRSLGFLNLGDFSDVRSVGGGKFAVTLVNVPTAVGAEINAGRIRSGSVELIPHVADPDDPAKTIRGPIITGLALLGEEHPAVKGLGAIPRAVFADGTPVPPSGDPTRWLEAMTDVAKMAAFSDAFENRPQTYTVGGVEYPVFAVGFSEYEPMGGITPEFLQSLGLSPDIISQIMAKEGGGAPDAPGATDGAPPAPPAPAVGGGDAPPLPPPGGGKGDLASAAMPGPVSTPVPDKGAMAADDQTMMSEIVKRVGALEKHHSERAAEAEKACMAAYSDRVEAVLVANVKRIAPNEREDYRAEGLRALSQKVFGAITGDAEKAFAKWKARIENLPESDKFSETVEDTRPPADRKRNLSPFQRAILNTQAMKQNSPELRTKLLASAGTPSAN